MVCAFNKIFAFLVFRFLRIKWKFVKSHNLGKLIKSTWTFSCKKETTTSCGCVLNNTENLSSKIFYNLYRRKFNLLRWWVLFDVYKFFSKTFKFDIDINCFFIYFQPRIVPLQLLKCLKVLLDDNGGILSESEVKRIAGYVPTYFSSIYYHFFWVVNFFSEFAKVCFKNFIFVKFLWLMWHYHKV